MTLEEIKNIIKEPLNLGAMLEERKDAYLKTYAEPDSHRADIRMDSDDKAEEPLSESRAKFLLLPRTTDGANPNRAVRSMSPMRGHSTFDAH